MTPKKWYQRIPHPVIMLFAIILLAALLSYILPAGTYERITVDGRQRVVPGSYQQIESQPLSLLDIFRAFPRGFKTASDIIFVVLASGIMFGILEKSRTIENLVGTFVQKLGLQRRNFIVLVMTFTYGFLGVAVGYENNIAMVPIAAVMSLAIGGDLLLAAGMSVAAITVGFGLSPINPYTVGTGHTIAEMPLFSGWLLRSVICFIALTMLAFYNIRYLNKISKDQTRSLGKGLDESGLALSQPLESYRVSWNNWLLLGIFLGGIAFMLYGVFTYHWYLQEIAAIFVMISILCGLFAKMDANTFSETALKSIGIVAPGAFMVGYATTIKEVLEMGQVSDTIAYLLASVLQGLPTYASAVSMSIGQSILNLMIPSGSGQALATLPIMIPLGEVLGLTRQTTILAFQIGDGVTNLFNPALGGLIAMLSFCRVPFDRWLRFIMPLAGMILLMAWVFLMFSVYINWGPV
ncbi:MAG: AbgT family transporter [Saprospiraceae bacterium]|nr:AbgT family transporter [Saprospiraceae bacterium]